MYDLWVKNIKSGECRRVTSEEANKLMEDLSHIGDIRFYPCCPKDAPKNDAVRECGSQMDIFDFISDEREEKHGIKDRELSASKQN